MIDEPYAGMGEGPSQFWVIYNWPESWDCSLWESRDGSQPIPGHNAPHGSRVGAGPFSTRESAHGAMSDHYTEARKHQR